MTKSIILSMFLLTLLALVAMNLARRNSGYGYSFSVPVSEPQKLHQDFEAELEAFKKGLAKRPYNASDLASLSKIYLNRAHETDGLDYYKIAEGHAYRSIHLMPNNNPIAYFVLADIALYDRDYNKAIRFASTILKQSVGRNPEGYLILARAYSALGSLDLALSFADELISVFPSEKAYTLRAGILSMSNRDKEAMIDFEEAIKLLEDDPVQAVITRISYAQFLMEKKNDRISKENARMLLKEALRIAPHSDLVLGLLGEYSQKEKDYPEAIKFFKAAFRESQNVKYLFLEALAQKQKGQLEYAELLMNQVEELLRDDMKMQRSGHILDLIRLLLERGNKKDFAEALRLALREKTLRPGIEAQLLYSWALEMNEQFIEARKNVRLLLGKNIYTPEVLLRAAVIEEKLRNKNLAEIYKTELSTSRPL